MSYWRIVFKRAWRETLEQIRWDSPVRVMTGIVAPVISGGFVWYFTGSPAWAGIATVIIIAAIGLCVLFGKMVTVPVVMASEQDAEISKRAALRETEDALKLKRETIGQLLADANALARAFCSDRPIGPIVSGVEEWLVRANDFADNTLNGAQRALLWSDAGILCGEPAMEEDRKGRWRWINYRAIRLQQIIQSA